MKLQLSGNYDKQKKQQHEVWPTLPFLLVCMTVPFTFAGRTSAEPVILRVGAKVRNSFGSCIFFGALFDE